MAVDYDLVILGGTDAARWAAITASRFHARVALVGDQTYADFRGATDTPAALASLGIDVIEAEGRFVKRPLQVVVQNRELRSRYYLLAQAPSAPESFYLSVDAAYAKIDESPQSWLIVGDSPTALQLSQCLVKQGHAVTLAARSRLLPFEEPDAAMLLQAQLEVDGVCILTHTPLPADSVFDQVLLCNRSFSPSQIVWAEDSPTVPSPLVQSLDLTHTSDGLWVDATLRTSHPRIYACGAVLGGYNLSHIARYEASLAVKNALFFPTHAINYCHLPWAILTEPALARVGLTAAQAQRQYRQIKVFKQPYAIADSTHGQPGLCHLIARDNNILVGAHLVGTAAAEMIHLLAQAVEQQRTVSEIANGFFIDA
ncbi:MAG: FAD-dependent oxidoreductase, partial [Cyanobacteria bacterium P01_A01_bin.17]